MNNAHLVAGAFRLAEYVTAMGSGAVEEQRFTGVNSLQIRIHVPHMCH